MHGHRMVYLWVAFTVLAGCQPSADATPDATTDPTTNATPTTQSKNLSCGATLPPTPYWDPQQPTPQPEANESFAMFLDPETTSEWVIVLVDTAQNKLLKGMRVDAAKNPADFGMLVAIVGSAGQLEIVRNRPCCMPPNPVFPPKHIAALLLEAIPRLQKANDEALQAAAACAK